MSVQAITWALGVRVKSATHKAVLLVVANYADAEGYCWPSQRTIAAEAECSERTVRSVLKDLASAGVIARARRKRPNGTFTTDGIRLPAAKSAAGVQRQIPPTANPADGKIRPNPAANPAGLTSLEPTIEPSCRIVSAPVGKETIEALIARAGDACDPTAPSLHHGADLNRLLRAGCEWTDDILPAVDQVAASFRRRRQRFNSWALLEEHAVRNRDARLAGLPAPQAPTEQRRSKASYADAITRVAKEMGLE